MFLIRLLILFVLVSSLCIAGSWDIYKSNHFSVYAPDTYSELAYESLYYLEKHRSTVVKATGSKTPKHMYMVLQDMGQLLNGYSMVHTNKISLFSPAPASPAALSFSRNWLETVAIHEQFHNHHLHHSSFNTPLGLFSTQLFMPLIFIEGLAVYMESQLHPYQGRLNDGLYTSILLTKAKEKKLPSLYHSAIFHNHFPLGQYYMYGGEFVDFLAQNSSSDFSKQLISWYFMPPSPLDYKGFKHINDFSKYYFQSSIDTLHTQFYEDLTRKSQSWRLPESTQLAHSYTMTQPIIANNNLYYIEHHVNFVGPYTVYSYYNLIEQNTASLQKKILKTFYSEPIIDPIRFHNNTLYIAISSPKLGFNNIDNFGRGNTVQLYAYHLDSKHFSLLHTDSILAYDIQDDGQFLISTQALNKHASTLKQGFITTKSLQKLDTFPFYITQIKKQDDNLFLGIKHPQASRDIYRYSISNKTLSPLASSQAKEYAFNLRNNTLYYTANYDHRYQLYALNLETNRLLKLDGPSFMTNPIIKDDTVYYNGLTSQSFGLYQTPLNTTKYSRALPTESIRNLYDTEDFQTFKTTLTKHNSFWPNLKTLVPSLRLPLLLYDSSIQVGGFVTGADKLGLIDYSAIYLGKYSNISINTRLFKPTSFSYYKLNQTDRFTATYPFYFNALDYLRSIEIGLNYDLESVYPSAATNAKYSNYELTHTIAFKLSNSFDYNIGLNAASYFKTSKISARITISENMNHYTRLRGFLNTVYEDASMSTASLEYMYKITSYNTYSKQFRILSGDLYGNVFIDYSTLNTSSDASDYVFGYEFILESAFNSLNVAPILGVSKGNSLSFYISLYSPM